MDTQKFTRYIFRWLCAEKIVPALPDKYEVERSELEAVTLASDPAQYAALLEDLYCDLDLARSFDLDLDLALDRSLDLARSFDLDLDLALDLARFDCSLDLDLAEYVDEYLAAYVYAGGSRAALAVPKLDAAILAAIRQGGNLKMDTYHTCTTTHCRFGWAITLAGAGALEELVGPWTAGAMIYRASYPDRKIPNAFASNDEALADINRCAEAEA